MSKKNNETLHKDMIEWLNSHVGNIPRKAISRNGIKILATEMTEAEKYEVRLRYRWNHSVEKQKYNEYFDVPLEEIPEEYREKIAELRKAIKFVSVYEEIIEWLKTHQGTFPRKVIYKDSKQLPITQITEKEKYEVRLRRKWDKSEERKIFDQYFDTPLEEIPEEYREKIIEFRKYKIPVSVYEEIIEWLEKHSGIFPRKVISRKGKKISVKEMTEEEKKEVRLRDRWNKSEEKQIFDEYYDTPLEEVPEEHREKIAQLRKYKLPIVDEIIEWLKIHEGKLPRKAISRNGRKILAEEMTEEEKKEVRLRFRWHDSEERKIFYQYIDTPSEEIPEEHREKILEFRKYYTSTTTYDKIIEWLETHSGKLPRKGIVRNKAALLVSQMTKEEQYEVNLRGRWNISQIKEIIDKYTGVFIDEVPEEYREKVANLRKYNIGLTTYQEIVKWLETHNGRMPRTAIKRKSRELKMDEMTEEEHYEVYLYARWRRDEERKKLEKYNGVPIEEIPEEYREKIATLRKFEEIRKKSRESSIKDKMRKAVGKKISSNITTREELVTQRQRSHSDT